MTGEPKQINNTLVMLLEETIKRVQSGEIEALNVMYKGRDGSNYIICQHGDIKIPDSIIPELAAQSEKMMGKILT